MCLFLDIYVCFGSLWYGEMKEVCGDLLVVFLCLLLVYMVNNLS